MDESEDKFINVAIRIRPCHDDHPSLELLCENPPALYVPDKNLTYSFDHIFSRNSSQTVIYKSLISPLVDKVVKGNKCIVFAYGQTGTGKSYTMGTDSGQIADKSGIIPRTINDLISRKNEFEKLDLQISYCEIYNNKVYDLLSEQKAPLIVSGFKRQELSTETINDEESSQKVLLKLGNRRVGATQQNKYSSRSHCIISISCNITQGNEMLQGKFNLVDLAGSESVGKTANQGSQFQEGVSINHSLHCIGKVINALQIPNSFVPYRESLITTVLKDSLSIRNYITLIACVSAETKNITETVQTLQFSKAAKKIKIRPEINVLVETYKKTHASPIMQKSLDIPKSTMKMPSTKKKYFTPKVPFRKLTNLQTQPKNDKSTKNITRKLEFVDEQPDESKENDFSLLNKLNSFQKSSTPNELRRSVRLSKAFAVPFIETNIPSILKEKSPEVTINSSLETRPFVYETPKVCHENMSNGFTGVTTFDDQKFKVPTTIKRNLRRHTVLTLKNDDSVLMPAPSTIRMPVRRSSRLSSIKLVKSPVLIIKSPDSNYSTNLRKRRSSRLSVAKVKAEPKEVKSKKNVVPKTPLRRTKRTVKKEEGRFSDAYETFNSTNLENYVLNILNNGDEKALQKLVTVGQKTAMQIYFYRRLNGNFKSIKDLKNLPWKPSAFSRFVKENLLTLEDSPKK